MTFSNVQLPEGENLIQAVARNGSGSAYSAFIVVTVVGRPGPPMITTHQNNQVVQTPVSIGGLVSSSTVAIDCYLNNQFIGTQNVVPFGQFSFLGLPLNYGGNRIDLVVRNEFYSAAHVFYRYQLDFEPDQTAIIIDKSDFRLWYMINGVLDCSFPIAHGKVGASTPRAEWIVGEKHYTSPGRIYGPRKLRLYRLTYSRRSRGRGQRRTVVSSGYSYRRTRFGNPRHQSTLGNRHPSISRLYPSL